MSDASTDKMAAYNDNIKAANYTVSARKPRAVTPAPTAKTELTRDYVAVAVDLRRVEQRQADQRLKLATTDAELAALQKELKTLADQVGKQK